MVGVTVKVEESLFKTIGQQALESQLQAFFQQLMLKMAVKDILSDFSRFDVTNDPKWQVARSLAWEEGKTNSLFDLQGLSCKTVLHEIVVM